MNGNWVQRSRSNGVNQGKPFPVPGPGERPRYSASDELVVVLFVCKMSCPETQQKRMETDQITIRVDKEAADAYRAASEEERRKIDSLLNLKLRKATRSQVSIKTYMDEISRRAEERGLTPEILESLLNEE